jgi:hypothetical protein
MNQALAACTRAAVTGVGVGQGGFGGYAHV